MDLRIGWQFDPFDSLKIKMEQNSQADERQKHKDVLFQV